MQPLAGGPRRAALCGLVAVQASLFYGYAQWGSIKEIAAVALIPAVAATPRRSILLAAVPAGALLDVYGSGGVIWAGPAMVAVVLLSGLPLVRRALVSAGGVAVVAVCAIPAIVVLGTDAVQTTQGSPASQEDIGKLVAPLETLQGAGLWPVGDFRYPPDPHWAAVVLALVGLALAVAAVVLAVRRRRWELPVLLGVVLLAAVAGARGRRPVDRREDPRHHGPVPAARRGGRGAARRARRCWPSRCLELAGRPRRLRRAPRRADASCATSATSSTGKGPTLVLNYEGYGTRYFLGPAQDEGISDLRVTSGPRPRRPAVPGLLDGGGRRRRPGRAGPVPRRRAAGDAGRQPHGQRLPARVRRPLLRGVAPHGDRRTPRAARHTAGPRRAADLPRAARQLATGASELVAAPAVNPVIVGSQRRADRRPDAHGGHPRPGRASGACGSAAVRSGAWRCPSTGSPSGSVRHQLDASVGWLRFDARRLAAGAHRVTLDYGRGAWRPGRGAADGQLPLGPVALSLETQPALVRVPAAQVDRLCDGRDYDWVEAVA